jgi:hypothetical protein
MAGNPFGTPSDYAEREAVRIGVGWVAADTTVR